MRRRSHWRSGISLVSAVVASLAWAAPATVWASTGGCGVPVGVTRLGSLNQEPADMELAGRHLFAADTVGLTVYDVGDGSSPVQVAQLLLPRPAVGVDVSGARAFVADGDGGLKVVDVGDPTHPVLAGTFDAGSSVRDVVASGTLAYAVTAGGELLVLDAGDPAGPTLLYRGDAGTGTVLRPPMAVAGSTLFLETWGQRNLVVVDVSDPTAPSKLAETSMLQYFRRLFVSGGYAYGCGGSSLSILDVHNPAHLSLAGTYGTSVEDVLVVGSRAYLASGSGGLEILDVSNPEAPTLLGSFTTGREERLVAGTGSSTVLLGTSATSTLSTFDTTDPAAPEILGSLRVDGLTRGLSITAAPGYAGALSVIQNTNRLVLDDLDDPTLTRITGSVTIPSVGTAWQPLGYGGRLQVAVEGGTACIADSQYGLLVADIVDPRAPAILATADTGGATDFVALQSHLAYATNGSELKIVDVSRPEEPRVLGNLPFAQGSPRGVAVEGPYAYVAVESWENYQGGLDIVDVSDPTDPVLAGVLSLPGSNCFDVKVRGDVAFLACTRRGLVSVDVSDPTRPRLLNSLTVGPTPLQLELFSSLVLLHGETDELFLVDASDPTSLRSMGAIPTSQPLRAVGVDEAHARAWAAEGGLLEAFDLHCAVCSGIEATADPPAIPVGGATAVVKVAVTDVLGNPAPGLPLSGWSSLGTLSPFQDGGDGTYRAVLTSGENAGEARVYVTPGGGGCGAVTSVRFLCPQQVAAPSPTAAAVGDAEVELTWQTVPGATGYRVLWADWPIAELGPEATSYRDGNLTPGVETCYQVAAVGACSEDVTSPPTCIVPDGFSRGCPAPGGRATLPTTTTDLAAEGDVVYVSTSGGTLAAFDISDPARPRLGGEVSFRSGLSQLVATDGRIYAVGSDLSLWILDATDPLQPEPVGRYPGLPQYVRLAASGPLAGGAGGSTDGFRLDVLDVSDPANPVLAASLPLEGRPNDLAMAPGLAVVGLDTGWLLVDLSDPSHPSPLDLVATTSPVRKVAVHRGLALIGQDDGFLGIYGLSDSAGPVLLSWVYTGGSYVYGLATEGTLVTVSQARGRLSMVDISNPNRAVRLGSSDLPTSSWPVALSDGRLAVLSGRDLQLYTLPCRAPVARFDAPISPPLSLSLQDRSLYGPTSWSWDFGDGHTSSEQNPVHIYHAPGLYTVSLGAANAWGSSVFSQQVRVFGRVDVNSDGFVDSRDLMDELAEIWDEDGTAAGDAAGGSHPGSAAYDIDANGRIGAEDLAALISLTPPSKDR